MNNNKTLYKGIILLFAFIIQCSTYAYTQSQLRHVQYATKTTNVFSVPLKTDMSLITDMDLSMMSVSDEMEIVEKTINSDFNITITREYPLQPLYSRHYQRMISKSVSDIKGITLYDRENNNIYSKEVDDIKTYQIEADALDYYGLYSEMSFDLDILAEKFIDEGYAVLIEDDLFSAISPNIEFYINQKTFVTEIRMFEDELMVKSIWRKYKSIGEYNILIRTINFSYDNLQNGIRCQKAKIVDYMNYSVIDSDGKYVVNYVNKSTARTSNNGNVKVYDYVVKEKKNSSLEIYPNPAVDMITVKSPYFLQEFIDIKVINTVGKIVFYKEGIMTGSDIEINISTLPTGVYVVMVGKDSEWKTTKLIKLEK